MTHYVGRFAPSPTGPLHEGSLVAALASWLVARAHLGRWLVRIEDVDIPRSVPGAADDILRTLSRYGFAWDGPVEYQSERAPHYAAALRRLVDAGHAYPCACTRRELESAPLGPGGERIYPGTCREGVPAALASRPRRAFRVRVADTEVAFVDRLQGPQRQRLTDEVGDFVVKRADDREDGVVWRCAMCKWLYKDNQQEMPFEQLPEDWKCPRCGVLKREFERMG